MTHKPATPLPWDTSEYWESMARNERAAANEDRARRGGSVESIKIHENNAMEYDERARQIRAKVSV